MSDPVATIMARLAADVAEASAAHAKAVDVTAMGVTSRAGHLPLAEPGLVSPNGACRLIRVADGWIAVNLAREEDAELIPAWLGLAGDVDDPWLAIEGAARARLAAALVAEAIALGIPVARVGETGGSEMPILRHDRRSGGGRLQRVVDVSALWAGPLCGAILAAAGADVLKIESRRRPDPSRDATPEFFKRLNGMKREIELDLGDSNDQKRLFEAVSRSDVLITSARPRAFAGIGFPDAAALFAANPALTWVVITGHGMTGPAAERVAFGDDAAAAGGLVRWDAGEPRFLGDALADPITGQAAAVAALKAVASGGGAIIDVAMARASAAAAHLVAAQA